MEKMIDTRQVLERIPFGRTWLDEQVKEGKFPKPVIYCQRNLWHEPDIDAWILKTLGKPLKDRPKPEESHAFH